MSEISSCTFDVPVSDGILSELQIGNNLDVMFALEYKGHMGFLYNVISTNHPCKRSTVAAWTGDLVPVIMYLYRLSPICTFCCRIICRFLSWEDGLYAVSTPLDSSLAKKVRNCKKIYCSKADEFLFLNKNLMRLLFVPLLSRRVGVLAC
jgi:hypothetical protein